MAAWIAACASATAGTIDSAAVYPDVPMHITRQHDVIDVLATMVLMITQEVLA